MFSIPVVTSFLGNIPVVRGGTNSTTALSGSSIIMSNGTSVIQGTPATTTTLLHGNAAGVPSYSAVSLTADVSGVLSISNGGTNLSTVPANGRLLIGNGTNYTSANLTAGTGITINNTAGAIEIVSSASGGTPAGNNESVQYNNSSAFQGSSQLFINNTDGNLTTLSRSTVPAAPAAGIKTFIYNRAREQPAYIPSFGPVHTLQSFLGSHKIAYWTPVGTGTTVHTIGMTPVPAGTATARLVGTGNEFVQQRRLGYVGTAISNSIIGLFSSSLQYWRGTGPRLGGFHGVFKWSLGTNGGQSTTQSLIGFTAATVQWAPGGSSPSGFLNIMAFGSNAGNSANLQFFHNDAAGTAQNVDLGANFPAVTGAFEGHIYVVPDGSATHYYVRNLLTNNEISGSVNSEQPANTQLLTWRCETTNGSSAIPIPSIDICSVYIETPY